MLAGQSAADAVGVGVHLLMEFFDVFIPFFVAHVHLAEDDVQVAVADVGVDLNLEGIIFADFHDLFDSRSDFMDGNDDVVSKEDLADHFA